ncbi:MAG: Rrf2 family transcriptional regulator [Ornithinimicrobium sp.]
MRISAKADYAVRAALVLAGSTSDRLTADQIAQAQQIPARFLESVLRDLRTAAVVTSQRGAHGGHRLSRPPQEVTLGEVIRAIDGPLVFVNGERPSDLTYHGEAEHLLSVWVAVRVAVRRVLDEVTLADVLSSELPGSVAVLVESAGAWSNDPS